MKKLKVGLVVVLILLVGVVAVGFALPGQYRVERQVVINAKDKEIYPFVNALKKWPGWTVWTTERDPTMTVSFSGPEEGVGAVYAWTSDKSGNGQLTITRSERERGVWYDLDFENGKYVSKGGLLFEPAGEATEVTWYNGGELGNNPINRYFGLFMDAMMGSDFEQGLANLKRVVEANK